jgi:hypothetical protein
MLHVVVLERAVGRRDAPPVRSLQLAALRSGVGRGGGIKRKSTLKQKNVSGFGSGSSSVSGFGSS